MKRKFLLIIGLLSLQYIHGQTVTPDHSFAGKGWVFTDFNKTDNYSEIPRQVLQRKDGSYVMVMGINNYIILAGFLSNGNLDYSFGKQGFIETALLASEFPFSSMAALQSDGKIVVVGNIRGRLRAVARLLNSTDFLLARYNTNGTLDRSFGNNGTLITDFGGDEYASSLVVQSDDKIVVAGSSYDFESYNLDFAVTRFRPDGSLDMGFGKKGRLTTDFGGDDHAITLAIGKEGKILVGGQSYDYETNHDRIEFARYNPNGSMDESFDGDGKLITSLFEDGGGFSMAIQPDGKFLVTAGDNGSYNDFILTRFNADGSLDAEFGKEGTLNTDFGGADNAISVVVQSNGKILQTGYAGDQNFENYDFALARYNEDGSLDSSFDEDGKLTSDFGGFDAVITLLVQQDGKIVAAGITQTISSNSIDFAIARYNSDGSLDNSFDGDGKLVGNYPSGVFIPNSLAIQSDRKILVAGVTGNRISRAYDAAAPSQAYNPDVALARYKADGSLDSSFGSNGKITADLGGDDYATSMAIQSDGKIVIAGYTYDIDFYNLTGFFIRYKPDGSLDSSFGDDGILIPANAYNQVFSCMAIKSDRKIIVSGFTRNYLSYDFDISVNQYNEDGSPDNSFGADGKVTTDFSRRDDHGYSLALQNDGKIVVAAVSSDPNNFDPVQVLVRYNNDGSLDDSFGENGKLMTDFLGEQGGIPLIIQTDGKIIVSGFAFDPITGNRYSVLVRYKSDGSKDNSFDGDGRQTTEFFGTYGLVALPILPVRYEFPSLVLLGNGKIVAAGATYDSTAGRYDFGLIRYNGDGSLDQTFGKNGYLITDLGVNSLVTTLANSEDRIYVGGYIAGINQNGIIAAYSLACADEEICGNRKDDNCDGQVDEGCPGMPFLTINDVTVQENAGIATLTVALSKKTNAPVNVNYFTADRTASSKTNNNSQADYEAARGMISIPAGSQSAYFDIKIINDSTPEPDEFFDLHLFHPANAAMGTAEGKVTIKDEASFVVAPAITSTTKNHFQDEEPAAKNTLTAIVRPNPSSGYFTLLLQSNKNSPLTIMVTDAAGRVIETRRGIAANRSIQLGHNYAPGIYYVAAIQREQRVIVKVIRR